VDYSDGKWWMLVESKCVTEGVGQVEWRGRLTWKELPWSHLLATLGRLSY
jgi:hypothetical protein